MGLSISRRSFVGAKFKIAATAGEKAAAIKECDFPRHGSGPSVVGRRELARRQAETDKRYGIYGVTIGAVDDELKRILDQGLHVARHRPGRAALGRAATPRHERFRHRILPPSSQAVVKCPPAIFSCRISRNPLECEFRPA